MGTTFKYISDESLAPTDLGPCHCCGDESKPAYDYGFGLVVDASKASDPGLAKEELEIHAACSDCIHSGYVQKDLFDVDEQIQLSGSSEKEQLLKSVHLIPTIPVFSQRWEWPICCDDWCEFVGCPKSFEELLIVTKSHTVWPAGFQRDFAADGPPEGLYEVSLFRCLSCEKRYFVDQFT